jgi:hypothetical protein
MPGFPVFNLATGANNGTAAVTAAWPTHATNDVALLCIQSDGEAVTLSTAAGFVRVTGSPQTTGTAGATNAVYLDVFWARATNNAMPIVTIADPGDHTQSVILTFTNCATSGNPWDLAAGGVVTVATTAVAIASAGTTTDVNRLVVGILAGSVDTNTAQATGWAASALTSVAEIVDVYTTTGGGGGVSAAAGKKAAKGATGTITATLASVSKQAYLMVSLISDPLSGTGTLAVSPPALAGTGIVGNLRVNGTYSVVPAMSGAGNTYIPFASVRQSIINGIDSAQAEGTGWDAVVKAGLAVTAVVRTSDTVVTITLPAFATYNVTAQETITATIPSTAVQSGLAIVATPTFTVDTASGPAPITGTGSLAVTANLSGSGHQTEIGTGSLAVSAVLTGVGIRGNLGTGSLAVPKPGLSGAGHQTETGSGSLAVIVPVLTVAGHQTETGTGSLAVTVPRLTAVGIRGNLGTGSLSVTAALSGSGTNTPAVGAASGSLAVAVSLSGSGHQTETGTGSLTGTVNLTATGLRGVLGTGSLAVAVPAFTGSGHQTETSTGSLHASVNLTGAGHQTETGTGSLHASVNLSGVGIRGNVGTGSLAVTAALVGSQGIPPTSGTGSLAVRVSLAATATQTETGTGSLAVARPSLSGSGRATQSGSGSLAVAIPAISGAGSQPIAGTGSLAVAIPSLVGVEFFSFAFGGTIALPVFAATLTPFAGARTLALPDNSAVLSPPIFAATLSREPIDPFVTLPDFEAELDLVPA